MTLPQIPKSDWYKNVEGLIQVAYTKQQLTEYGQTCYQAGRDSMKAECVKAVDDAGGDNTDYHMNAMKELK